MSLFELISAHLKQPEYLHVLLNPLPVYGLALSTVALGLAIVLRSRRAQITALVLIFISALSAWPVAEFGEQGYDRVEAMSDHDGYAWLDAHAQRATRIVFVFYILAGMALLSLILPWKMPKSSVPLASVTLGLSLITLGCGVWIAYAGGQIRHKEFRYGLPSEKSGGYEQMR